MSSYYLVEVDVHTLQLEVGRSVVPKHSQGCPTVTSSLAFAYWPEPSSPCSPEIVCLYITTTMSMPVISRRRINTPESSANLVTLALSGKISRCQTRSTYTLTGLEMHLDVKKSEDQPCCRQIVKGRGKGQGRV